MERIKQQLAEKDAIIEKQRNKILLLQEKLSELRKLLTESKEENEKLKIEIKNQKEELENVKKAFDTLQEEMITLKQKLREKEKMIEVLEKEGEKEKKKPIKPVEAEFQLEQLKMYENLLEELKKKYASLQMLIVEAIVGKEKAVEEIKDLILKEGPLEAKILTLIYVEGISNVNELAKRLEMPAETLGSLLFMFEEEGLIKLQADKITVPSKMQIQKAPTPPTTVEPVSVPEVEVKQDVEEASTLFEEWKSLPTDELFDNLLTFCRSSKYPEQIGDALETVCDILESRLKTFGGLIRFEMRREADYWRKGLGNLSELEDKISDWRIRAKKVVKY